jgi:hypothetical protein
MMDTDNANSPSRNEDANFKINENDSIFGNIDNENGMDDYDLEETSDEDKAINKETLFEYFFVAGVKK